MVTPKGTAEKVDGLPPDDRTAGASASRAVGRAGGSLGGRRAGAGGNPAAIRGAALGKSGVQRAASRRDYGTTAVVDLPSTHSSAGQNDRTDEQDVAVPSPDASDGGRNRSTSNWKRALGIGVLCFVVWLILDAPTLMTNAEGSPLGTRRTVAMDFLRPISWISRETGLSHIVGAVDRILGRERLRAWSDLLGSPAREIPDLDASSSDDDRHDEDGQAKL